MLPGAPPGHKAKLQAKLRIGRRRMPDPFTGVCRCCRLSARGQIVIILIYNE